MSLEAINNGDQSFDFMDLPDPVRIKVLSKLDLPDFSLVCLVSKPLRDEALDHQVWRFNAKYLYIPLKEGGSIFEQVKRAILLFRERANGLIPGDSKFRTFQLLKNAGIFLTAKADLSVFKWTSRRIDQLPDLTQFSQLGAGGRILNSARVFRKWCLENKEKLAVLPLDVAIQPGHKGFRGFVLNNQALMNIPLALWFLKGIELLNLSNNRIGGLPPLISQNWKALHYLNISNNYLTSFPEELRPLTQIVVLDISNNRIPSLPQWIRAFDQLSTFDYFGNPITTLPDGILKIFLNEDFFDGNEDAHRSLELPLANRLNCPIDEQTDKEDRLSISFQIADFLDDFLNRIKPITVRPADIDQRLEAFTIDDINYIQNWLISRNTLAFWDALAKAIAKQNPHLNCSGPGIENMQESKEFFDKAPEFPKWCEANEQVLAELTCLDLSDQHLFTLPQEIKYLTNLQELNLSNNILEALPAEFSSLVKLLRLNLDMNCFDDIPSQLQYLVELQELSICGYIRWSDVVYNLKELRILNLSTRYTLKDEVYNNLPKLKRPDLPEKQVD